MNPRRKDEQDETQTSQKQARAASPLNPFMRRRKGEQAPERPYDLTSKGSEGGAAALEEKETSTAVEASDEGGAPAMQPGEKRQELYRVYGSARAPAAEADAKVAPPPAPVEVRAEMEGDLENFSRKKQAVDAIFSAKDYLFKPQWIVAKAKSFMEAFIAALRLYSDDVLQAVAYEKREKVQVHYRRGLRVAEADTYLPRHAKKNSKRNMKIIIATTVFDDPSELNQPPEKIGTEWRKATNAFQFHMRMEMCKALRKEADGRDFFLGRFYHGAMTHVSFLAFDLNYGPWEKKYYYEFIKEPYGDDCHVVIEDFSDCFGECPTESDESSSEDGEPAARRKGPASVRGEVASDALNPKPSRARRSTADGATNSNSFRQGGGGGQPASSSRPADSTASGSGARGQGGFGSGARGHTPAVSSSAVSGVWNSAAGGAGVASKPPAAQPNRAALFLARGAGVPAIPRHQQVAAKVFQQHRGGPPPRAPLYPKNDGKGTGMARIAMRQGLKKQKEPKRGKDGLKPKRSAGGSSVNNTPCGKSNPKAGTPESKRKAVSETDDEDCIPGTSVRKPLLRPQAAEGLEGGRQLCFGLLSPEKGEGPALDQDGFVDYRVVHADLFPSEPEAEEQAPKTWMVNAGRKNSRPMQPLPTGPSAFRALRQAPPLPTVQAPPLTGQGEGLPEDPQNRPAPRPSRGPARKRARMDLASPPQLQRRVLSPNHIPLRHSMLSPNKGGRAKNLAVAQGLASPQPPSRRPMDAAAKSAAESFLSPPRPQAPPQELSVVPCTPADAFDDVSQGSIRGATPQARLRNQGGEGDPAASAPPPPPDDIAAGTHGMEEDMARRASLGEAKISSLQHDKASSELPQAEVRAQAPLIGTSISQGNMEPIQEPLPPEDPFELPESPVRGASEVAVKTAAIGFSGRGEQRKAGSQKAARKTTKGHIPRQILRGQDDETQQAAPADASTAGDPFELPISPGRDTEAQRGSWPPQVALKMAERENAAQPAQESSDLAAPDRPAAPRDKDGTAEPAIGPTEGPANQPKGPTSIPGFRRLARTTPLAPPAAEGVGLLAKRQTRAAVAAEVPQGEPKPDVIPKRARGAGKPADKSAKQARPGTAKGQTAAPADAQPPPPEDAPGPQPELPAARMTRSRKGNAPQPPVKVGKNAEPPPSVTSPFREQPPVEQSRGPSAEGDRAVDGDASAPADPPKRPTRKTRGASGDATVPQEAPEGAVRTTRGAAKDSATLPVNLPKGSIRQTRGVSVDATASQGAPMAVTRETRRAAKGNAAEPKDLAEGASRKTRGMSTEAAATQRGPRPTTHTTTGASAEVTAPQELPKGTARRARGGVVDATAPHQAPKATTRTTRGPSAEASAPQEAHKEAALEGRNTPADGTAPQEGPEGGACEVAGAANGEAPSPQSHPKSVSRQSEAASAVIAALQGTSKGRTYAIGGASTVAIQTSPHATAPVPEPPTTRATRSRSRGITPAVVEGPKAKKAHPCGKRRMADPGSPAEGLEARQGRKRRKVDYQSPIARAPSVEPASRRNTRSVPKAAFVEPGDKERRPGLEDREAEPAPARGRKRGVWALEPILEEEEPATAPVANNPLPMLLEAAQAAQPQLLESAQTGVGTKARKPVKERGSRKRRAVANPAPEAEVQRAASEEPGTAVEVGCSKCRYKGCKTCRPKVQPRSASPDHLVQDATAIAAHYLDDASPLGVSTGGMSGHGNPTPLWVKNAVPHQTASPSIVVASPPTAVAPAEPSPKPRKKAAARGKGKTKGKGLGAKVPTSKQASAGKRRVNRVRADAAFQQESLASAAGAGRRATRSSSRA